MAGEEEKIEPLSSEVQDVVRNLVSAIRAVKLYPSNNPIYSQTIEKSSEVLVRFLETESECRVGVQKTYFTYAQTPVGKETQLNRAIAQDLFAKGIREVVFSVGVTEEELADFYRILALSPEELAMRSGISSVLWERGTTHIRVTEAGLDDVITAEAEGTGETVPTAKPSGGTLDEATAGKEITIAGRRLVLGDLMTDPGGFGAGMIELAKQTTSANESVDDRLFALYTEAGRKIWAECADQSDTLFEGLAQSALSLDQSHRERLIAGKLYAELDAELESEQEQKADPNEQVPNALHEIVTGRFSTVWTGQQVSTLLKKSSARKTAPPAATPPGTLDALPISKDLGEIARDLAEYTPEEMEALKAMSEAGMESDIIEASVRTLIFLLPEVKKSGHSTPDQEDIRLFSGVVRQLEEMQSYLLKKKDYDLAALIARAFHVPVDPAFEPRMTEAANKAASSDVLIATINDLKNYPAGSPEYLSACSYLATAERETTETLLELLATEADRSGREFLIALLKDLVKNQLMLIGEHLSDKRWYFVRNIVIILAESKSDLALPFLHKVANHKDARIRREVIKGLVSIGGKKAASLVSKYLDDKVAEIQLSAIHGLAGIEGSGDHEEQSLMAFLTNRPLKRKGIELTIEAIRALAKIGGRDAEEFLARYNRIRWWKPKKLQVELRSAAKLAQREIKRRQGDGERARQ
jgi:hypothetical protein